MIAKEQSARYIAAQFLTRRHNYVFKTLKRRPYAVVVSHVRWPYNLLHGIRHFLIHYWYMVSGLTIRIRRFESPCQMFPPSRAGQSLQHPIHAPTFTPPICMKKKGYWQFEEKYRFFLYGRMYSSSINDDYINDGCWYPSVNYKPLEFSYRALYMHHS